MRFENKRGQNEEKCILQLIKTYFLYFFFWLVLWLRICKMICKA
jgi:hypothetical protein